MFSGTGVGRLREFLNQQKAHAANEAVNGSIPGSVVGDTNSEMGDIDDPNPDSDGVSTPVMSVNVHGNNAPGATPVVATPPPANGMVAPFLLTQALHNQTWLQNQPQGSAGASNLSQSAPASTGGPFWGAPGAATGLGIGHVGGAQHVTGMMGATILDEVDEGDEAFGEGSEIMGD